MRYSALEIRNIVKADFFNFVDHREKIKFLLRYAILAPSTHNSQPWAFKIDEDRCEIFLDETLLIREADPLGRDLYISFGCLIENLIIASEYFKVFDKVVYENSRTLIATVYFKNLERQEQLNKNFQSLVDAIPKRVNSRGIFESKKIPREFIDKLKNLNEFPNLELHLIGDSEKIRRLAELTAMGLREAYSRKEFRREMSQWVHHSLSGRKEGIPGYSLRMPLLISFIFPLLLRFLDIGKGVGMLNFKSVSSVPLVAIISAPENSKTIWIDVGRLGERIMLQATSEGIKASIFVASIEIGNLYKEVQKVIASSNIPHFLICLGYMGINQRPNLRHSVEEKIIE